MIGRPIRICFVCTHSFTLATLYKGLFPYLAARGYEIEVVVGDREYTEFEHEYFGEIRPHVVPMRRMQSPVRDPIALARMYSFFRAKRFDLIHVSTPKASLLGSIAGKASGARVVFVYRRCVYELMIGFKRWFYSQSDRIICAFSDVVLPISRQIHDHLVQGGLASPDKVRMIGQGSSNGLDTKRFSPDAVSTEQVAALRQSLDIAPETTVLLFLGRVCSEKGVDMLPRMLDIVRLEHPDTVLIVAGPKDERDPPHEETQRRFLDDPAIRRIGYVADPSPLYALCDVFVFPSLFEGFGNVLLEAAAHERVAIGFDVPGVKEAIADSESGILVPKGNARAMAEAVNALLSNPETRLEMAARARRRIETTFSNERVWKELDATFRELLGGEDAVHD